MEIESYVILVEFAWINDMCWLTEDLVCSFLVVKCLRVHIGILWVIAKQASTLHVKYHNIKYHNIK